MKKIKYVETDDSKSYAVLIPFESKSTAEYCAANINWANKVVEVINDE